ncbi:SGNH/GDSL hydrolase family protein [Actinophytocola gossypii]|uniref:SGNH/GDSL hydrolase family protein n=1 Tax=Actinophytocola gossypii TaxID=2812003 RepID=A0ABT2J445_9PSEU|nr:SGNH/GDSL hydrolase family protein [Actinophytocola gossypii]MCT2582620.1 SGNH/GDSL hydrolase family protein [Actinophytocola gossypii]
MPGVTSWVAIGDSFTEGLSDEGPDGGYIGWADRLAETLAARDPDFRYANLALRGKLLREIIDEQVPVVEQVRPDLVTMCAGGNDLIVPGSDVDELANEFEAAVAALRAAGCEVVVFTGPDPRNQPVVRRVRGKVAIYNAHLRAIADRQGARVVDLWAMPVLADVRAWSDDRLHFSPEGHRRIALRTAEVLGVPVGEDWREPWPPTEPTPWIRSRQADLVWTRTHLLPWVRRQLRGESMGDGLVPKRPELRPITHDHQATA